MPGVERKRDSAHIRIRQGGCCIIVDKRDGKSHHV